MIQAESINDIFRAVVRDASRAWRYEYQSGKDIAYIFGDWSYIAETLTVWGKDPETCAQKFPCVALYSPFWEQRGGDRRGDKLRDASLQLLIMTNTRPEYDNETRERVSFDAVLRPVYYHLLDAIRRNAYILTPYRDIVSHEYSENYRYGRSGVNGADGKTFFDYIDAIEIRKLNLTFKTLCKNG